MKQLAKSSILIIAILLVGGLYISTYTNNPTVAVGNLDAGVEAGDTYYYNITKFPSFTDMNLTASSDNATIDITGGFEGSTIYVKVIDTNYENMTYWDGTRDVFAVVPTVDIAAGMILGQDIVANITVNGTSEILTFPQGMGLPVPTIFGTTTMFNASNLQDGLLPLPLVLNDDYVYHELFFTQISSRLSAENRGSLTVTNDNTQFRVDLNNVKPGSDNSTVVIDGFFSYRKPDGLLQELNMNIYNGTTLMYEFDIDLVREEFIPLDVVPGDHFELTLTDAGFTPYTGGFDPADDPLAGLQEAAANMSSHIGDVLIEFTVVEVDGLYYSVEGSVLAENGSRIQFPAYDGYFDDLWFVGFGRYGLGQPMPNSNPGQTWTTWFYDYYNPDTGFWDYGWETVWNMPRNRALTGPFITQDYEIYQAWDLTSSVIADVLSSQLVNIMENLAGQVIELDVYSSTTDTPIIDVTYTSVQNAGDYSVDLSIDLDIGWWMNLTSVWYEWNGTDSVMVVDERYAESQLFAGINVSMAYSSGQFSSLSIQADFNMSRYEYNSTHTLVDAWIAISDYRFDVSASYSYIPPPTTTTTTSSQATNSTTVPSTTTDTNVSTTQDTSVPAPELPLPIFGIESILALFGFAVITVIIRRRR